MKEKENTDETDIRGWLKEANRAVRGTQISRIKAAAIRSDREDSSRRRQLQPGGW